MLNKLWGVIIIAGITVAAFSGNIGNTGIGMLDSAKEAVSLGITMLGIMALWTGVMNVAEKAGIIKSLTGALGPVLKFLFPNLPREHIVNEYISVNMISNVLGLGWAATPMGLKAMQELKKLNGESDVASTEMCTFLVVNMSSLQLIPVNIIAYRSQYGSVNPAGILAAAIIATTCSTAAGIIYAKAAAYFDTRRGRSGGKR